MASRPLQSVNDCKPMDGKVPGGEMPAPTLVYDEPDSPAPPEADSARIEYSSPASPTSGAPSFSFPKLPGATPTTYTDSSSAHTSDQLRPLPDLSRVTAGLNMNHSSDYDTSPSARREGLPKTSSFMLDLTMVDLERRSSRGSSANQSGSHSPHQVVLSPWNRSYDSCESASELLFPLKAAGAAGPDSAPAKTPAAKTSPMTPSRTAHKRSKSPSSSPWWATTRPRDHFKDPRGSDQELESPPRLADTSGAVGEDTGTLAAQSQSMVSSSASAPSIVVSSSSSQMPRTDSGPTKDPLPKEPAAKDLDMKAPGDVDNHPSATPKLMRSSLPRKPRSLLVKPAQHASARGVVSDRSPKRGDVAPKSRDRDVDTPHVRGPHSRSRSHRGDKTGKTDSSSQASIIADTRPMLHTSTASSSRRGHSSQARSSSSNGGTTLRTPKPHVQGSRDGSAIPCSPNLLPQPHSGSSGGLSPMNSATRISHPRSADDSTGGNRRSRAQHRRDTRNAYDSRIDPGHAAGSRRTRADPSTPGSSGRKHRSTSSKKAAEVAVSAGQSAEPRRRGSLSPVAGSEGPRSKDKTHSCGKRKEKGTDGGSSGLPSRRKHESTDASRPKKRSSKSPRPHEGPSGAQSPRHVEQAAADRLDGSQGYPEMLPRVSGKPQHALLQQQQQRQEMYGLHDNRISNAAFSKRDRRRHKQDADTSMSTAGVENGAGVGLSVGVGGRLRRQDACDSAAVLRQPAVCDSGQLEGNHPLEVSAEFSRQGSLSRPLSGSSSKLGGSSRLADMKSDSSASTWRLSEAMLGPGVLFSSFL